MISVVINIKGRDWTFHLLPDKRFDKLHNQDGGLSTAMTLGNQYEVHFKKSEWTTVDIRHELGHVLKCMSHTNSVELSAGDMEELMCELYASNYADIGMWTEIISQKFFDRK